MESLTLEDMFYEVNKNLCETYIGLNPLQLLDYPAEDVFNLINQTINYNSRNNKKQSKPDKIRRKAGDNWF